LRDANNLKKCFRFDVTSNVAESSDSYGDSSGFLTSDKEVMDAQ